MADPLTYANMSLSSDELVSLTALRPRYSAASAFPPVTERAAVSVSKKFWGAPADSAAGVCWEKPETRANAVRNEMRSPVCTIRRRDAHRAKGFIVLPPTTMTTGNRTEIGVRPSRLVFGSLDSRSQ